jgi:Sec-independent protein translocase protein TatA
VVALVVFGPIKAAGMARDLGCFVDGANRTVEELKGELVPEELKDVRRTIEEVKGEAQRFTDEELGTGAAPRRKTGTRTRAHYRRSRGI